MGTRYYLYIVLAFLLFVAFAYCGMEASMHLKFSNNKSINSLLVLAGTAVFFVGCLILLKVLLKDSNDGFAFPNKSSWSPSYAKLDQANNTSDLEITKAKKCCGGLFADPKYCNDPKNQDAINTYCCNGGPCGREGCKGYVGRPVYFDYTVESDALWNNPRCSMPMSPDLRPPVL